MPFASFAGANAAMAPLSAVVDRRRNLADRVLSGVILGPLVIAIVFLGGPIFGIAAAAAAGLGLREWLKIVSGAAPLWVTTLPLLLVAAFWSGGAPVSAAVLALLTLGLGMFVAPGRGTRSQLAFGLPYVGITLLSLVWLRSQGGNAWAIVLFVLLMVWASDIGAFFAGRLIGGPRLAPRISPNKTWSGFGGGLLLAALVALAWRAAMTGTTEWGRIVMLAIVLSMAGQAGDLFESAVKRRFGVKDSGQLIPGHGGMLDRIDALLAVAPLFAVMNALGLTAGLSP
jgi:phosphatidate cytidylyltransferase